jgi:hypothetical protein
MLAEYFREKDGAETLVTDGGFLAFLIIENQFFITDFYLSESHRKSGKHFFSLMRQARKLGIEKGCSLFSCRVPLSHKNLSAVIALRLKFGFKIVGASSLDISMILPFQEASESLRRALRLPRPS